MASTTVRQKEDFDRGGEYWPLESEGLPLPEWPPQLSGRKKTSREEVSHCEYRVGLDVCDSLFFSSWEEEGG